jgi:hypothetical protein
MRGESHRERPVLTTEKRFTKRGQSKVRSRLFPSESTVFSVRCVYVWRCAAAGKALIAAQARRPTLPPERWRGTSPRFAWPLRGASHATARGFEPRPAHL